MDDGVIGGFMMKMLGRSWRTSLFGLMALVCGVLVAVPGVPVHVVAVCKVLLPLVSGGGLMLAKDQRVTGVSQEKSE